MGTKWSWAAVAGLVGVAAHTAQAGGTPDVAVQAVASPPTRGASAHYIGNRAPLAPEPLIKLPTRAVRPQGWLETQLRLMAEGMTGRLEELSPWCRFEGSAWAAKDGKGKLGWEELPYWLKGFTDLAFVLDDPALKAKANRWLNAIVASQRPDGYFGPEENRSTPDLWPNMLALAAVRSRHEAVGGSHDLDFLTRYFRWQSRLPLEKVLPGSWQKLRGADNLEVIYWLYNRTGDKALLPMAQVNHERTSDWTGGNASWHGVNLAQGWREPAQYFQQSGDKRYLASAVRNYNEMRRLYGQVPGGMYGSDENCRPGYTGPRQGTEACSFVEMMYSHEELLRITGDPLWADRCEEVAFNGLPCAQDASYKALHYLTAPNQVQLDRANKAPDIQNGGDMMSYTPYEAFRCCQHNIAFGWPYYAERLVMATRDNGLAASLYAPCNVQARVGAAGSISLRVETQYPFGDTITFRATATSGASFPLYLRIPGWCAAPQVTVNGKRLASPAAPRGWLRVTRTWRAGDALTLRLPMAIKATVWKGNRNTVSLDRGPLTYSLKIPEEWRLYSTGRAWDGWEVYAAGPWNYGLVVDPANPAASVRVQGSGKPAAQPFAPDRAGIELIARARRIPEWKIQPNGLVAEVQPGPIATSEPEEEVTLIPMGCARLRITAFPRVSANGKAWGEGAAEASSSYRNEPDPITALNDGQLPTSSADGSAPRFTWWDHRGTAEWVQYDFPMARRVEKVDVYWFDDGSTGGQCRVPASVRIVWWDGQAWQPTEGAAPKATKDKLNTYRFAPVTTSRLRMEVQLQSGFSGGILEWEAP